MNVRIETVKAYNARKKIEWEKAVQEWQPEKGGFPNVGCWCWMTRQGEYRKTGYVLSYGHTSILTKTKKEAVAKWNAYLETQNG